MGKMYFFCVLIKVMDEWLKDFSAFKSCCSFYYVGFDRIDGFLFLVL